MRHFFTLECCLRTWLERTLIYSSKNHELCIPFGQNFNLKLLIALFFCELLLCRCILNLLLLNSYSILAADFCKNFLTKAYSQSLERPYRETTIGGFCYPFFGEETLRTRACSGGWWLWCGVDALILLAVQTKFTFYLYAAMDLWTTEHDSVFPHQQREMSTNSSESAEGHSSCRHYDIRIHKLINLTTRIGAVQYYHH